MRELETDILILGGSLGAAAAALAIARAGRSCILTDPTDWIGGQLTAQAVPPDENQWVETLGATSTYQSLRARIRVWYRENRALSPQAADDDTLNPGGGWVSRLCVEPVVAHEALRAMLEPEVQTGRVRLLLDHEPVSADVESDSIRAVELRDRESDARIVVKARLFLDASDTGELYPLAGAEHLVGSDAHSTFNEMHAPPEADPLDQQAITWCFAIEHRAGEDHRDEPPPRYDFWRAHVPATEPPWPGPLLSMTIPTDDGRAATTFRFLPTPQQPSPDELDMWRYRRVRDASICPDFTDATIINWVQNDYWLRPVLDVDAPARELALSEARELSACLLHWLRTEVPRPDGGAGYQGLKLCPEVTGTHDGFAKAPYIREPRRLLARTMLTEAHLGHDQRLAEGRPEMGLADHRVGHLFDDSIAIAHYMIDLHPSCAGRNSVYVRATPFRVPLGALVPVRLRNLLASGKALGVSHIANGATRTHAAEWAIGEAAGTIAAACLEEGLELHQLAEHPTLYRRVQQTLVANGAPIAWPWEPATPL